MLWVICSIHEVIYVLTAVAISLIGNGQWVIGNRLCLEQSLRFLEVQTLVPKLDICRIESGIPSVINNGYISQHIQHLYSQYGRGGFI